MVTVTTAVGEVERDKLAWTPVVTENENALEIAIEWTLDGELVRRDVWVNVLRGLSMGAGGNGIGTNNG